MNAYRWRGIDPDTGTDYDADRFDRALEELYEDEDAQAEIASEFVEKHGDLIGSLLASNAGDAWTLSAVAVLRKLAAPMWDRMAKSKLEEC
jgi:hypothetical protein